MKRGPRKALLSIVNLPMLNSEVVTGVSLMLLYAMVNIQLGYLTLLLSHIAFLRALCGSERDAQAAPA